MKKFIFLLLVLAMIFCSGIAAAENGSYPGIEQERTSEPKKEEREGTDLQPQDGPFVYIHDPRTNDEAMADIIENADAVYGFSPDPEYPHPSTRRLPGR